MEKHFDIKSRKPFAQKGNLTSLDTVLNDGISTLQMEKPKAAPKYKTGNRGSATPRPKSAKSLLDMDTVVRPDSRSGDTVNSENSPSPKKTDRKKEIANMLSLQAKSEQVDLCFMLDCSGSMGPWIDAVKNNITTFYTNVRQRYSQLNIRFAFVRYTDFDQGENRITHLDFTADISNFEAFVASIIAQGGGDEAEDVLGGLSCTLNNLSWRPDGTHILIHIADAPCHGSSFHPSSVGDSYPKDPSADSIADLMKRVVKLSIQYWFGYIVKEKTDIMIEKYSTEIMQYSQKQLRINQFDAKEPINIVGSFHTAVDHSILNTIALGDSKKWTIRDYSISTDFPNWKSTSEESVKVTRFELPTLTQIKEGKFEDVDITIKVKVAPQPFAEGGVRLAYYCYNVTHDRLMVAKQSKRIGGRFNSKEQFFDNMKAQSVAAKMALDFNKQAKLATPIKFVVSKLIHFKNRPVPFYMALEPHITGNYTKYNSNSGKVFGNDLLQAFSHWTWSTTNFLLIVDLQGVETEKGILLTDPALHCTTESYYGNTNFGILGIRKFFESHQCNSICKQLKLPPFEY